MSGVGNPRAHPALDLLAGHGPMAPPVAQPPQAVAEAAHVRLGQAAPAAGEEDDAQELRRLARRHDAGLAGVEPQAAAFEEAGDAVPPLHEPLGVVVEEREVVHIAQVALRPQDLLAEVVEAVEMDVGEELAGQVADGQAPPALEGCEQVVAGVVQVHRLLWGLEPSTMRSASARVRGQAMRRRRSRLRISWSTAGK